MDLELDLTRVYMEMQTNLGFKLGLLDLSLELNLITWGCKQDLEYELRRYGFGVARRLGLT